MKQENLDWLPPNFIEVSYQEGAWGIDYDVLTLNQNLTASDVIVFNGTVYNPDTYSNSPTAITRANNEIFVYNRIDKQKYVGKKLIFNRR